MSKLGKSDDSQKAKHGGNRAGEHKKGTTEGKSSQAAGKDPGRGERR